MPQLPKYVIIVAGGTGARMNTAIPKQFLEINGLPVLMHTIKKFAACVKNINILVVLPETHFSSWKELCEKHQFKISHHLVSGGQTRFNSVKNGLLTIKEQEAIVAVHDAVRPLVSATVIVGAFEVAEKKGNAVPAIQLNESIREVIGEENKAADRSKFIVIQTPQCFKLSLLVNAYKQDYVTSFTDDATVVETNGEKINIVPGNPENIKITTPSDLIIANAILNKEL